MDREHDPDHPGRSQQCHPADPDGLARYAHRSPSALHGSPERGAFGVIELVG